MATRLLTLVLFVLAVVASSAFTALYLDKKNSTGGVSKEEIGKIVGEFIEQNPEVVIQGLQNAQIKREQEEARKAEENIAGLKNALENNAKDPVAGDKNGDVTMVVFHDYSCGYCRKSVKDVAKLIENDPKVKVVMKDMPILGPVSDLKAKASVAISRVAPEKWYNFYTSMADKSPQNEEQLLQIVSSLGINSAAVKSEMNSNEVEQQINDNKAIAQQIGIRGTPAFVIDGQLVKGAVGYDTFKNMVDKSRG